MNDYVIIRFKENLFKVVEIRDGSRPLYFKGHLGAQLGSTQIKWVVYHALNVISFVIGTKDEYIYILCFFEGITN